MNQVNKQLKQYIENEIFPLYEKNDAGHQLNHILYVIERSFKISQQFSHMNSDMIYTIAAFHDIAHHINKDTHELLSAAFFAQDQTMQEYFTNSQRTVMIRAIEDHRASSNHPPRNNYGKILSSADRTTDVSISLKRTHSYTLKHYQNLTNDQIIERAYQHISSKFGENGYAKSYVKDEDFEQFLKEVHSLLLDKNKFAKVYKEVNGIDDIVERAKVFAISAHMGQVRKNEPDKPMIIHPLGVGNLLKDYGYDDHVVVAGILHDIVEDTKYTIQDIENEFGSDIASLVKNASEPDKSLSWEERKQHTVDVTKTLSLRHKLPICADKINNLEDLMITLQKNGKRDFSAFKRGEALQNWYYTSMYESLIYGEDETLPIFKRLKTVLDVVFQNREDTFLTDIIFSENPSYYENLKKLHAQKMELQRLKALSPLPKPFVIEFLGTPRTGKTSTISNIYDFLKKGGFQVLIIEEFTTSKYYKQTLKEKLSDMNAANRNIAIMQEVYHQLKDAISSNYDIILIDRSIHDRQVWNYRQYLRGGFSQSQYTELKEKYDKIAEELIDVKVIGYVDAVTALKRDYACHLSLETRNFLSIENIEEYNKCLMDLIHVDEKNMIFVDTASIPLQEVSVKIANKLMPSIREKLIDSFVNRYQLHVE